MTLTNAQQEDANAEHSVAIPIINETALQAPEQQYRAGTYALLGALLRNVPTAELLAHTTTLKDAATKSDDLGIAMSKSKEELAIKEAVVQGNHNKALSIYQTLVDQRISDSNEFTIGTANMYEAMASLHALAGNKAEEKAHYLKSLDIKKQLKKVSPYSLAHTYFKLGTIAEAEQQYDQAQHYYEQSLSTKLVDIKPDDEEGFFEGMTNQANRQIRSLFRFLNSSFHMFFEKRLGS